MKKTVLAVALSFSMLSTILAEESKLMGFADHSTELIPVTLDNFVRAASDNEIAKYLDLIGGINQFVHYDAPVSIGEQVTIRSNRDVLMSVAVINISEGARLSMPDDEGRYRSAMVVNQEQYVNNVLHDGGAYELTMDEFETEFVLVFVRHAVNAEDPADVAAASMLQHQLKISDASDELPVLPNYNVTQLEGLYKAAAPLAPYLPDSSRVFGKRDEVDPLRFFVGAALGWGGLPESESMYEVVAPQLPVGEYKIEVPPNAPVEAFWSVAMYDEQGFYVKNDLNAYTVNSNSGVYNADGSMTVHLGGCEDGRVNCLPLPEGWNYIVRMYQPQEAIRSGDWKFPSFETIN